VSFPSGESIPSGVAYTLYGVTYPVAEGGTELEITELSLFKSSDICDVDYVYEGFPPYTPIPDWTSATNIQTRPNGHYYGGDGTPSSSNPMEVPFESGVYFDSIYIPETAALADGYGGYTWTAYGAGYYPADTLIYNPEGTGDYYYWDGDGGYYYVG
jgi:hypothetical protein